MGLGPYLVSTYQAVSGAGMGAILETQRELREVLNDGVDPRDLHAEILPSGGDKKICNINLFIGSNLISE